MRPSVGASYAARFRDRRGCQPYWEAVRERERERERRDQRDCQPRVHPPQLDADSAVRACRPAGATAPRGTTKTGDR
jgi:hypothetical protein